MIIIQSIYNSVHNINNCSLSGIKDCCYVTPELTWNSLEIIRVGLSKFLVYDTYLAIIKYFLTEPVIIFVPSHRQCRLTVDKILTHCTADDNNNCFLNIKQVDLQPHCVHSVQSLKNYVTNWMMKEMEWRGNMQNSSVLM